jgi:DNA-binding NtrC family response regulator
VKIYSPIRVLISGVEIGEIISEWLGSEGIRSRIVVRSESLLSEFRAGNYEIVILTNNDIRPDEILDFIAELKKLDQNVKILVMAGWMSDNFPQKAMALGISGFLRLPFKPDVLKKWVKDLLASM